jgi:hypothetical protein
LIAFCSALEIGFTVENAYTCYSNFINATFNTSNYIEKTKSINVENELKISEYERFVKNLEKHLKELDLDELVDIGGKLLKENAEIINIETEFKKLEDMIENKEPLNLSFFSDATLRQQLEDMTKLCLNIVYNHNGDFACPTESQIDAITYAFAQNDLYTSIFAELKEREAKLQKKQENNAKEERN